MVRSLLIETARLANEHGGGRVEEIRVEIGPLSGVEPLMVQSAFERLVQQSSLADARLRIEEVPLTGHCLDCGETFPIEQFRFRCRSCGSPQIETIAGDSVRLLDFTLAPSEREVSP